MSACLRSTYLTFTAAQEVGALSSHCTEEESEAQAAAMSLDTQPGGPWEKQQSAMNRKES